MIRFHRKPERLSLKIETIDRWAFGHFCPGIAQDLRRYPSPNPLSRRRRGLSWVRRLVRFFITFARSSASCISNGVATNLITKKPLALIPTCREICNMKIRFAAFHDLATALLDTRFEKYLEARISSTSARCERDIAERKQSTLSEHCPMIDGIRWLPIPI